MAHSPNPETLPRSQDLRATSLGIRSQLTITEHLRGFRHRLSDQFHCRVQFRFSDNERRLYADDSRIVEHHLYKDFGGRHWVRIEVKQKE